MHWWGEGLLKGLPDAARKLFSQDLPRLVLRILPGGCVEAVWRQEGKERSCGSFCLNHLEEVPVDLVPANMRNRQYLVELCLEEGQVLHLQHYFPEAVKDNLKQVVGYQLDRLTPFSMENAWYDVGVARHDKQRKEILADVYVSPKHTVDAISRQLDALGVGAVQVVSVADSSSNLNLLTLPDAESRRQGWSKIPLYFFLGALALSVLGPLAYKYRRVGQLDAALTDLRRSSAEQLAVRDELMVAEEALQFIEQKRRSSPVALDVVEKLSNDIPSHTWLERLTIEVGKLEIRGESGKALTLIDMLEEAPEFSNVRFKSPLTRNKDNGNDRFHIEATLEVDHAE